MVIWYTLLHKTFSLPSPPWPFSHWGFNLVGQVYPNSSNGHKYIIAATEYFTKIVFQQILRANNKVADAMATIASMISMLEYSPKCEFLIENLFTPAYEKSDSELVYEIVGPESPWYADIFSYLHQKTIPIALTPNQSKTFICWTTRYTILGDTLF